MKLVIGFLTYAALIGSLAACSVKTSGKADDPIIPQATTPPAPITLDALNGTWTSGCINGMFGENYGRRIITVTFDKANATYIDQEFQGTTCDAGNESQADDKNYKGTYSVAKTLDAATHVIEYKIPINATVSSLLYQKIAVADAYLMVSELGSPDQDQATAAIKLTRQSSSTHAEVDLEEEQ